MNGINGGDYSRGETVKIGCKIYTNFECSVTRIVSLDKQLKPKTFVITTKDDFAPIKVGQQAKVLFR